MRFDSAHFLWFLLLAVLLVLLRWLGRKPRRASVASLMPFRALKALAESRKNPYRDWWKLLLQLLILACFTLALARAILFHESPKPPRIIFAFDRSPSLLTQMGEGQSRLDKAKDLAKEILDKLPRDSQTSLWQSGPNSSWIQNAFLESKATKAAIEGLSTQTEEFDLQTALNELSFETLPIVLISDGEKPKQLPMNITWLGVGNQSDNLGFTSFNVREKENGTFEFFVLLKNFSTKPARRILSFNLIPSSGVPVEKEKRSLDLKAGEEKVQLFDLPSLGREKASIQLSIDGGDSLPLDDILCAQSRPKARLALIPPVSKALRRALAAIPGLDYQQAGEGSLEDFDLVLAESNLPKINSSYIIFAPKEDVDGWRIRPGRAEGKGATFVPEPAWASVFGDEVFTCQNYSIVENEVGGDFQSILRDLDNNIVMAIRTKEGKKSFVSGISLADGQTDWPHLHSFPLFMDELIRQMSNGANQGWVWEGLGFSSSLTTGFHQDNAVNFLLPGESANAGFWSADEQDVMSIVNSMESRFETEIKEIDLSAYFALLALFFTLMLWFLLAKEWRGAGNPGETGITKVRQTQKA